MAERTRLYSGQSAEPPEKPVEEAGQPTETDAGDNHEDDGEE